jgi:hypothetical protein
MNVSDGLGADVREQSGLSFGGERLVLVVSAGRVARHRLAIRDAGIR